MNYALANLSLNVNANVSPAKLAMVDFSDTARESMLQSAKSVEAFQADLMRAANDLQMAAQDMSAQMQTANQAIVSGSEQSRRALEQLDKQARNVKMDHVAAEAKQAFHEAADGVDSDARAKFDSSVEWVEGKLKILAISVAAGAVVAGGGAIYAAYRVLKASMGFIEGLFTGASYKSDAIDELIATNNQVKALQENLLISARDAGALLDVFRRLGGDKDSYVSVFQDAAKAMRGNTDELDRLGVKYKDQNGHLLQTGEFLQNVKNALDEYTEGYDRNAAAAAMGVGSYTAINEALKVTQAELQASKDRMDDFVVAIGPQEQAEVARYEQAMRNFNNEMHLTSQGFKRAIADNIMPALTDLAEFFSSGWSFVVRAFRYSMATITSLLYGLKTVADIVVDAIKGGFGALQSVFLGTSEGLYRLVTGDFSGAFDAFKRGFAGAAAAASKSFDEMVADAVKNRDRMLMAWGLDDRNDNTPRQPKGGKTFVPAQKPDKDTISQYKNFLDELDRSIAKLNENEYAAKRLQAQQLALKEGITDLSGAYDRINRLQRAESAKVVDAYVQKLAEETSLYAAQTQILQLNGVEQDVASQALQRRRAAEEAILQAKKSGKPLTDEAIARLRAETEATVALESAQIRARDTMQRSASFGAQKALADYQHAATDAAKNAESFIVGSLQRQEDALIEFAKTGKLSYRDLFSFMAEEYLRQMIRMQTAQLMGGSSGLLGNLASAFFQGNTGMAASVANALPGDALDSLINLTGGFGTIPGFANGLPYVPYDGYIAKLHKGEGVLTAQDNAVRRTSSGAMHFDFSGQTLNVGQGVSRSEMYAAQQQSNAAVEARMRRLMQQKVFG